MILISRMSLILSVIGVCGPELWALDFTKNALFCLVYTLASIHLKQSLLNFTTMYVAARSRLLKGGSNDVDRRNEYSVVAERKINSQWLPCYRCVCCNHINQKLA